MLLPQSFPLQIISQYLGDVSRRGARVIQFARLKGNGRDDRVPAAPVLLAQFCKILTAFLLCPGIGSHRYFRANRRLTYADTVDAFGEEVIRDELVVAVEIVSADIELYDATGAVRS